MNDQRELVAGERQSPGTAPSSTPTAGKRNSGIFSFLKWFRSTSKESVASSRDSPTSSLGSVPFGGSSSSLNSTGTAASFNYISPAAYAPKTTDRCIHPGPETDTYKARLQQRDRVREKDKNVTLRKKYNLFFHRDKGVKRKEEDSCKSLPLMTRSRMSEEDKGHRRTNSDSSKCRKAGAYCHVKGKRKAPPPPQDAPKEEGRKKRLAPAPPNAEVIQNDCLKLDGGVLKPTKDQTALKPQSSPAGPVAGAKSEIPVSPKPWYKRAASGQSKKRESKLEPVVVDNNNHRNFQLDKRKSNMMFLTNISELDREASEIIKNQAGAKQKPSSDADRDYELPEMPEFMKPRVHEDTSEVQQAPAKRKSARDLIAKFNAITSVTKVTVNSALFNASGEKKKKDAKESKKNNVGPQMGLGPIPLTKSETTTCILAVQSKPPTPKLDRPEKKSWICPKCSLENDYWRIICHVCSTIKPYFDNFASSDSPTSSKALDESGGKSVKICQENTSSSSSNNSLNVVAASPELPLLMRSKTQINFAGSKTPKAPSHAERDEKEKLKKMLIEMKNSLPKRKSHVAPPNRKSTIDEGPETLSLAEPPEMQQDKENAKKIQAENEANVNTKDDKLVAVDQKMVQKENEIKTQIKPAPNASNGSKRESPYQLLGPKDFEDIYSEKMAANANSQHFYANLPGQPSRDLFFNVPKKLNELKHNLASGGGLQGAPNAADTLEINKLLRRLENAIAMGELNDAAGYAKDLAQLKVNCSVIRQKPKLSEHSNKANRFVVEMFVEDRLSHRGPFPVEVYEDQTVFDLKQQVQKEFEIPVAVQRWILGKELAGRDQSTLKEHNVTKGCPIFLYLVAPAPPKSHTDEAKTQKVVNIEVKELNVDLKATPNTKVPLGNVTSKPSNLPVPTASGLGSKIGSPSMGFVRSEKSAFAVVSSEKDKVVGSSSGGNSPRIVGEHLKVHVMIKPKSNAETQIGEIAKSPPASKLPLSTKTGSAHAIPPTNSSEGGQSKPTLLTSAVKTLVSPSTAASSSNKIPQILFFAKPQEKRTPPRAEAEDFSEYDKTMRPPRTNKEARSKLTTDNKEAHWICHMCTLVNNPTANICSVCATVRQRQETSAKAPNKMHYYELMHLDNSDVVPNSDAFECLICLTEVQPKEGVTLRECLHQFCKACLAHTIEFCDEAEVKCPYRDADYSCDIALQDREIKALVTRAAYDQFLAKSVTQAESKMDKTFHCKTPDCTGWCVFEDNVNEFRCPICKRTNCLTCQAIHWGLDCRQYQERVRNESETDEDARRTREWLNEMVAKGEALACPACHVVMMKKWGCDWVRCSMCKTEICWVTRGLRWGPGGKGDTSGGCKCGVNGVKCHARCNYCH